MPNNRRLVHETKTASRLPGVPAICRTPAATDASVIRATVWSLSSRKEPLLITSNP